MSVLDVGFDFNNCSNLLVLISTIHFLYHSMLRNIEKKRKNLINMVNNSSGVSLLGIEIVKILFDQREQDLL